MRANRLGRRLAAFGAAALISATMITTATVPAHAQAPSEDVKDQAKENYVEGNKRFKAGDYAGALPFFQKADQLYPGAAPKWKIAVCLDKLGRAPEAVTAYRTFVDSNPGEKYADRVGEAGKRIAELEANMPAKVTIKVTPENVQGLQITVDTQPQQGTEFELPAGEHTIIVTAEGYEPSTQVVSVRGAEKKEVAVTLAPVASTKPPPAPPSGDDDDDDGGTSNIPAYVTLGIAGAGAILGTVFGVQALMAKSDFEDEPTVDNADSAERAALIADMSFGVALTFGITGAVLLFSNLGGDSSDGDEASLKPIVVPYAGPTGAGMAATWTF